MTAATLRQDVPSGSAAALRLCWRRHRPSFERGQVEATINAVRDRIDRYRSEDGQSLRTGFPRLPGLA